MNKLKCKYCDYIAKRPQDLGRHVKLEHPTKYKPKKYVKKNGNGIKFCPECGCNLAIHQAAYNMAHS